MKTALERITALEFEVAKLRAIIKHYEREDSHESRHDLAILQASQCQPNGYGLRNYLIEMDKWDEHPRFQGCPDTYSECRQNPEWMRKVRKEKYKVLRKHGLAPRKGTR
jgi:hypothetical protein